jgi:hypothetical protein
MSALPPLTPDEIRALPAIVPVWPIVGRCYGISKDLAYRLAAQDELPVPVMRVGRLLRPRPAHIFD